MRVILARSWVSKKAFTGDTLCDANDPIVLESITFPEPVISVAIEPKTTADQEKMGEALRKLSEEDPTFRVRSDEETGQTIIAGMGELHLEVIGGPDAARIPSAGACWTSAGCLSRIDHPAGEESRIIRYVKQTGGHGQYGHVVFDMEPGERGSGIVFENKIVGGVDPQGIYSGG